MCRKWALTRYYIYFSQITLRGEKQLTVTHKVILWREIRGDTSTLKNLQTFFRLMFDSKLNDVKSFNNIGYLLYLILQKGSLKL